MVFGYFFYFLRIVYIYMMLFFGFELCLLNFLFIEVVIVFLLGFFDCKYLKLFINYIYFVLNKLKIGFYSIVNVFK